MLDAAQFGKEHIIIKRYGKPVAAILPYEDYEAVKDVKTRT